MGTIRASQKGQKLIEEARQRKGWTTGEDSEAIPEASLVKIRQVLKKNGWKDNQKLTEKQVRSLGINNKKWIDATFAKPGLTTYKQIQEAIKIGELKAEGISYRTWSSFGRGKNIKNPTFQIYCEALELNWEEVREIDLFNLLPIKKHSPRAVLGELHGDIAYLSEITTQEILSYFNNELLELKNYYSRTSLHIYTNINVKNSQELSLNSLYIEPCFETKEFDKQSSISWKNFQEIIKNPSQKILIRGKLGSGKTALLKYIASQCFQIEEKEIIIPILIEFKKTNNICNLRKYLEKIYDNQNKKFSNLLMSSITKGNALILLDGLDEIPETQWSKIQEIIFDQSIRHNRFIVTCRINYKLPERIFSEEGYQNLLLRDFSDHQINEYSYQVFLIKQIEYYCQLHGQTLAQIQLENYTKKHLSNLAIERVKDFWLNLDLENNSRLKEIAKIPLLLHHLLLIFDHSGKLPDKKYEIYEQAIDLLLEKWNNFSGRLTENKLSLEIVKKLLRKIAIFLFKEGRYTFSIKDLRNRELRKILEISLPELGSVSNIESICQEISINSGLLIEDDSNYKSYQFLHNSFQEYLVAEEYSSDELSDKNILFEYITSSHWHEIFLLLSEMRNLDYDFVSCLKQKVDTLTYIANDAYLQEFLKEVNNKSSLASVPSSYHNLFSLKPNILNSELFRASYRAFYIASFINVDIDIQQAFWEAIAIESGSYIDYVSRSSVSNNLRWIYSLRDNQFTNSLTDALTIIRRSNSSLMSLLEAAYILDSDIAPKLLPKLQESLREIQKLLKKSMNNEKSTLKNWWDSHGQVWTQKLKLEIIEYKSLFHTEQSWNFNNEQIEALTRYYDANLLLSECLYRITDNSDNYDFSEDNQQQEVIENKIKKAKTFYLEIAKTLFLPINSN